MMKFKPFSILINNSKEFELLKVVCEKFAIDINFNDGVLGILYSNHAPFYLNYDKPGNISTWHGRGYKTDEFFNVFDTLVDLHAFLDSPESIQHEKLHKVVVSGTFDYNFTVTAKDDNIKEAVNKAKSEHFQSMLNSFPGLKLKITGTMTY